MLGGHFHPRSVVWFSCHIRVIRYLVRNCFSCHICTRSAGIRLVWHIISPVHIQVYWTSVVCEVSLWSQITGCALRLSTGCACWFICRCVCRHLTPCTYHSSLNPLVDSSPGALATAIFLKWSMHLMVLHSCASGTVIVCCRGLFALLVRSSPSFESRYSACD